MEETIQSGHGILYVIPTPIGNLEDITLRAIRILKEVDMVLCEDTSVTQRLFKQYDITTKTSVFFAQTGIKNIEKIMSMLEEGKSLALVSDAGTPTISDPGVLLVDKVRKERYVKDNTIVVNLQDAALFKKLPDGSYMVLE